VALIKVAQRLGIPLAEIGEALKRLPTTAHQPQRTGKSSPSNGAASWMNGLIS
jgi:DNA-binding transcriptional MerR regulator